MSKYTLIFVILLASFRINAQPNCEAYLYYGDTAMYNACVKSLEISGHYQFSREFQEVLDESIKINPSYAYAYTEKAVAYLKSGDFINWKILIDKAVELEPKEYLGYRAWCRYQFFRDYEGAIKDIEKLDSLVDYSIGTSADGDYHLHIARALCYKALGDGDKAIKIILNQIKRDDHYFGLYDNFHLGVLFFEKNDLINASKYLMIQNTEFEYAETEYYLALIAKENNEIDKYELHLNEAKTRYLNGDKFFNPYTHIEDKIYLTQIEKALQQLNIAQ